MKKVLFFLLTLLIGLWIFYFIIRTVGLESMKYAFSIFLGAKGIAVFGLTFLMLVIGVWKWKLVLKTQGHKVSLKELLGFRFSSFSMLFFAPMLVLGGDIFRSYALKEKKDVPWEKAMGSVIIDRILEWTCNLMIVLSGVVFFILKVGIIPHKFKVILFGSLIILIMGAVFFYIRSFRKKSILRIFMRRTKQNHFLDIEQEVFKFFKPKKIAMWKCLAISFFRSLIAVLRCWLVIMFLGKGLAVFPAISILGFYFLALLIPIPAALGSHDALQAFAFSALGLGAGSGAAFATIIRGAELAAALIGLVLLFRLGVGLIRDIFFKKIDIFLGSITNSKE